MKTACSLIAFFMSLSANAGELTPDFEWSAEAHHRLIRSAFEGESGDCLAQMESGSDDVDRLSNQGPDHSYLHAMRSPDETVEQARSAMARFVRREYEIAIRTLRESRDPDPIPLLQSCFHRGRALHPMMDITSPAHSGFRIWSPWNILEMLRHGSFLTSIEDAEDLLRSPDRFKKTIGLMRAVDQVYRKLGFLDYLFDGSGLD